jgi:MFS family permease
MWAATVVSFVGCWMYTAASGWLMTDLTSSSLLVSLVQAAASLAIFLFALPAGALADIVNRRKYLIACERDLGAGRKHRWTAVRTLFIAAASALITIPLTGRWKLETGPVWI